MISFTELCSIKYVIGHSAIRVHGNEEDPASAKGAWFIREFVLACEMFAHTDHLVDLLTKVIHTNLCGAHNFRYFCSNFVLLAYGEWYLIKC